MRSSGADAEESIERYTVETTLAQLAFETLREAVREEVKV